MRRIIDLKKHIHSKVQVLESGCWKWLGNIDKAGYGQGSWTVEGRRRTFLVHRLTYELFVGPIPLGLTIDHLCRNRGCVNPEHLEPVTHQVNVLRGESFAAKEARQTHCLRGHEFTVGNTYFNEKAKNRSCKICHNYRNRLWRASKKLKVGEK